MMMNVSFLKGSAESKLRETSDPKGLPKMQTMYIEDDGIMLSAVLDKPERLPEKCPLVIVLHGFTSNKEKPHTLAACRAMNDAGFATLRVDMYGHGESGGEFKNHTLFKWLSNVLAVLDYARKLDFVTDLYLSGHSQGGLAAILAAGIETDRIRGLILRAPAIMIPEGARKGNLLRETFDPEHIPDVVPTIKGLELNGNYIRTAQMIHVEEAIGRYKGPVLIVHGENDDVVPLHYSVEASKWFTNCELKVIAGDTHSFDLHKDQMADVIRNWLRDIQRDE